jgi:Ca2+-binding RTX toxin-like protein
MAVITGTPNADFRNGTALTDQIDGLGGNDTLNGLAGDDLIHGGDGNDSIIGGEGADQLFGDAGDDIIYMGRTDLLDIPNGPTSNDFADGGTGTDTVTISWLNQGVNGLDVSMTMNFNGGNFTVTGGGFDWEHGINFERLNYYGSNGGDVVIAGALADYVNLGTGNDHVQTLAGDDVIEDRGGTIDINAGLGTDLLILSQIAALTSGFNISGTGGTYSFFGGVTGTAAGIERLRILDGTAFADLFTGGSAADDVAGGAGADQLSGGVGNDTLSGGDDDDVLAGGDGNDNLIGGFGLDTITGGAGHDGITGGAGNDLLSGGGGDDTISGGEGDDQIAGGAGNDSLAGDLGNDTLSGGTGDDLLSGFLGGNDVLDGGAGFDTASYIYSGPQDDGSGVVADLESPAGNTGDAVGETYVSIEGLLGTSYRDTLRGNDADNIIDGGYGADVLEGRGGADQLIGGTDGSIDTASYASAAAGVHASLIAPAGNTGEAAGDSYSSIERLEGSGFGDVLTGDMFNLSLSGLAGNDLLIAYNDGAFGNAAPDELNGGAGDDTMIGGRGADHFIGGSGNDLVRYDDRNNGNLTVDMAAPGAGTGVAAGDVFDADVEGVAGGIGLDTLFGNALANQLFGLGNADNLQGRGGNDTIWGGDGNDSLFGGDGNDFLGGDLGNDLVNGGAGGDRAVFNSTLAAVVNLNLTVAQNTGYGMDTLLAIENVTSGSGNDRLTGNGLANILSAGIGNDTLNGSAGNDALYGSAGNDRLTGGTGADTFVFTTALGAGNVDRITDFSVVDDTIQLENAVFTGLANGVLTAAAFVANVTGLAADALDRVIYETDTGKLFFDADGSGAGARVHFAALTANLTLTNADFFVF